MGQLRRLLGGLGGKCGGGFLSRKRRGRNASHVKSCPECTALQWRERQYLERLRRASVPAASDDLTARLLARTQQLAMAVPATVARQQTPAGSPGMRVLGLVAGGAMAAAGMVTVGAYIVAGDPVPAAGRAPFPSFQQQATSVQQQAIAGSLTLGDGSLGNAGSLEDAGSLGAAGTLTPAQLESLRTHGWSCPELRDMGFHVLWARREAVSGQSVLEMRLTDGRHFATVLEQHTPAGIPGGAPLAATLPSPTNVLTGHPAAEDGFVPAPDHGVSADGKLWINAGSPWKAIYQTAGVTFTYVSDLPADTADDGVAELMRAGATSATVSSVGSSVGSPAGSPAGGHPGDGAAAGAGPAPETLTARLQRGLGRIMGLFAA